jgi:DNA-binding response OmpR family regulator
MERGRILIMGETKESTYEIRNLLDSRRFELEIALSPDLGKAILSSRRMSLVILHTEIADESAKDFFEFLDDRGIDIPIFILGEEAARLEDAVPEGATVACFGKPYAVDDMLTRIQGL